MRADLLNKCALFQYFYFLSAPEIAQDMVLQRRQGFLAHHVQSGPQKAALFPYPISLDTFKIK